MTTPNTSFTPPLTWILTSERIKESTKSTYSAAMKRLAKHAGTDPQELITVHAAHRMVDAVMQRTGIKQNTWSVERSAVLFALERALEQGHFMTVPQRDQMLNLLAELRAIKKPREEQSLDNKKKKPKTLPGADCKLILDLLDQWTQSRIWAESARLWLEATLVSGLRPSEWQVARWNLELPNTLRVLNGKTKKVGPAFLGNDAREELATSDSAPPWRDVPIAPDDVHVVDAHIRNMDDWLGADAYDCDATSCIVSYRAFYEGARQTLRQACLQLWGKGGRTYPLYSARSQYSANTSAAFGPDITATRMGHCSSDSVSTGSYGRHWHAHAAFQAKRRERIREQGPAQSAWARWLEARGEETGQDDQWERPRP